MRAAPSLATRGRRCPRSAELLGPSTLLGVWTSRSDSGDTRHLSSSCMAPGACGVHAPCSMMTMPDLGPLNSVGSAKSQPDLQPEAAFIELLCSMQEQSWQVGSTYGRGPSEERLSGSFGPLAVSTFVTSVVRPPDAVTEPEARLGRTSALRPTAVPPKLDFNDVKRCGS